MYASPEQPEFLTLRRNPCRPGGREARWDLTRAAADLVRVTDMVEMAELRLPMERLAYHNRSL
ncbi:MAG: hypothetical protein IBGAMO2_430007 [Arenicellales bacterium IbO2]|nr:MAG: hypothetical protein IBGAMO2_430007 [Arenicellales bacterium IbO2]